MVGRLRDSEGVAGNIMTHRRTAFLESTYTILGCTSKAFWSIYEDDKLETDVLSNDITG